MSEVFKNAKASLTTSSEVVYTCPAETTAIIMLMQVANINETSEANVNVMWTDVSDLDRTVYLVKNAPVPIGGALNTVGGKFVLETGDSIKATASVNGSLEMSVALLEIS